MSDFDHGAWARAKAELVLNPLPDCSGRVVDRLLAGEVIDFGLCDSGERMALRSLYFAGVIDYYAMGNTFAESKQLRAAHERGLISELFA